MPFGIRYRSFSWACSTSAGCVYHANYYSVFEQAREAMLAEAGLPYSRLAENSQHLAISESGQRFLKPVHYGEPLDVYLWISELRKANLLIQYEIESSETPNDTRHSAWTRMAFIENVDGTFKPARIPQELADIFTRYTAAE